MSKKRIYEYAKELNLKSKEIIDELKSMNVEVSNHMQALEEEQIKALDKKNNKVRIIVNQRRKKNKTTKENSKIKTIKLIRIKKTIKIKRIIKIINLKMR